MKTKTVIFTGPQGSGKGTQLNLVKEYLEKISNHPPVATFDSGSRLRAFVAGDGYPETVLRESLEQGEMSPDCFPIYMFTNYLVTEMTQDAHLLIDGFPRNILQLQVMDAGLDFYSRDEVNVINFELDREEAIFRIMRRNRVDDTEEKVDRRLGWYESQVKPLLHEFRGRRRYKVSDVDASQSPEDILESVLKELEI